jgi:hypothetical protein
MNQQVSQKDIRQRIMKWDKFVFYVDVVVVDVSIANVDIDRVVDV